MIKYKELKNIKISVIIPVYNVEKYIEQCLESVLNQTLKDIEIIVINDGSTDSSLKKIEKYKNDKKIIIIDKKNEGVSKTRNIGLQKANGKYVYFIDSDDYLESDVVLEKLYIKSEEENLDILNFDYYEVHKDEKKYIKNLKAEKLIKNEIIKSLLNGKEWGIIWNKLIKKDLFLKNKILFPENIFFREDLITVIKLIYFSKRMGKINEAFYNYIQHEKQTIKNFDKKRILMNDYNFILELKSFFESENQLKKYSDAIEKIQVDLYCNTFRLKNRKLEIYKILSKKLTKENIKMIYNSKYFKEKNLSKKIRFIIFSKVLLKSK